jgi:hypothetical protein
VASDSGPLLNLYFKAVQVLSGLKSVIAFAVIASVLAKVFLKDLAILIDNELAAGPAETTPLQQTVRMASREAEPRYRASREGNNSCSLVFTSFCFCGVK